MEKARLRTGETLHHNHAIPNGADVVERNGRDAYLSGIELEYENKWPYKVSATEIWKYIDNDELESTEAV